MKRSAALSSSPVVMPGRILPASSSIVLTRMAPAAAMWSISAGDFLTIMTKRLQALFEPQGGERGADVVVDLHLVARPVEAPQQPALLVVVDERLGLVVIGGQALADRLGLVVLALAERPPALVALVVVLRGVVLDVVEVPVGALAAAREALHHAVVRRVDEQRGGEPALAALHLLGQRPGLSARAREAVEQEAVVALVLDLVEDHRDDEVVGDELALVHVVLGLPAELGALAPVLAQQVARADVGHAEVLGQPGRLGALARARGPEQDEVELAHRPRRLLI